MSTNPWLQKFGLSLSHNPDFEENGKQYYGFIFGHPQKGGKVKFSEAVNYTPQGNKIDENGFLIKSQYSKPGNEYQTEILSPIGFASPTVGDRLVHSWKTCQDQLHCLEPIQKTAVNAIKKWLNGNKSALWYHDSNPGECGFGGHHLHIVIESATTASGNYCRPNAGRSYGDVTRAIKNAGGYYKSQAITDIDGYVTYCSKSPREFLGTKSNKIARVWKRWTVCPKEVEEHECAEAAEIEKTYEGFGEEPDGARAEVFGEGDDEDSEPSPNMFRRATVEYGESIARKRKADEMEQASVEENAKEFMLTRETAIEKYVNSVAKLMAHYNVYDKERLKQKAFEDEAHKKYLSMLISKRQYDRSVEAALEIVKIEWSKRTMIQLCELNLKDKSYVDNAYYMSLPESIYAWFCWAHNQFGCVRTFVETLSNVVDRKTGKKNTFLIVGASNTGKTFFFNKPLQKLQPMKTLVGSMGNASPFMWEKCQGQRLIFIDECKIDPTNIETAKLLFGGEEPEVGCKGKIAGEVLKVPVICSGNVNPWHLARSDVDIEAMKNRCFRYTTVYLKGVPQYTKDISPHIWWYLVNSLELFPDPSDYTLQNINKQYPETSMTVQEIVDSEAEEELQLE